MSGLTETPGRKPRVVSGWARWPNPDVVATVTGPSGRSPPGTGTEGLADGVQTFDDPLTGSGVEPGSDR